MQGEQLTEVTRDTSRMESVFISISDDDMTKKTKGGEIREKVIRLLDANEKTSWFAFEAGKNCLLDDDIRVFLLRDK